MSETKPEKTTEESHDEHIHQLPLLQAFIALFVLTTLEYLLSLADHSPLLVTVLLVLTFIKMTVIAAVFMEVAFDKDATRIVISVFVVPFVAVVFLLLTINADWRAEIIA